MRGFHGGHDVVGSAISNFLGFNKVRTCLFCEGAYKKERSEEEVRVGNEFPTRLPYCRTGGAILVPDQRIGRSEAPLWTKERAVFGISSFFTAVR